MKIFSKRLIEERKSKDITQEAMAKLLGISYATYKNYEYGVEPPFEVVCKIAKLFDVSIDYLFGLID